MVEILTSNPSAMVKVGGQKLITEKCLPVRIVYQGPLDRQPEAERGMIYFQKGLLCN